MDQQATAQTRWREGERVRLRGDAWTIATVTQHADCAALRLIAASGAAPTRTVLVPFDRPAPLAPLTSRHFVHPRRWLHAIRRAACHGHPFGALADPPAGPIDLLPYQLEPALAVLRHGATRLLIADAVGLGKTIQSGLLLHTLAARQPPVRALVVTPAGLREQWARELATRFALEASVCDAGWLRRAVRNVPPDIAPWALPGIFIVSFDFIKRPEVLRPLEDLTWDLLIVDEAHNASAVSARRSAVEAVASRSTRVLLLTATPHTGDDAQFAALCSIGAASAVDRIVMFRRSRGDVGLGGRRRSVMLAVTPSAAERRLHRLLDRYTAAICHESRRRHDTRPRLMAVVLKKRALSSAASLAISVRRRLDLLAGVPQASQLPLPLGDEDPLDDEVDEGALAVPGLSDAGLEQRLLKRILRAADAATAESKPAILLRLLRRVREPAIVFTEYRDTLARLRALLLKAGHDVTLLHGGQLPAERASAQQRFNSGGGVLLATDAASEGLNLHERCRVVVHYELPWTPARLEQRAGRVDRIGQRATVHEILLVAGHPAERLVLAPLARRAARARSALGTASRILDSLAESAIADAVLDGGSLDHGSHGSSNHGLHGSLNHGLHGSHGSGQPRDLFGTPVALDLSAEAADEAARLALRRTWLARSGESPARRDTGVLVTRFRRSPATSIYALSLASRAGRVEHHELFAIRNGSGHGHSEILALVSSRIQSIDALYAGVRRALHERAASLRAHASSTSRALVQAGLFDRRAVLAHRERARVADRLAEGLVPEADAGAESELTPDLKLVALLLD